MSTFMLAVPVGGSSFSRITRRNVLLLVDSASLQQAADFLIEKELMNQVFTGNDV
jgi:hypothetical protein